MNSNLFNLSDGMSESFAPVPSSYTVAAMKLRSSVDILMAPSSRNLQCVAKSAKSRELSAGYELFEI